MKVYTCTESPTKVVLIKTENRRIFYEKQLLPGHCALTRRFAYKSISTKPPKRTKTTTFRRI